MSAVKSPPPPSWVTRPARRVALPILVGNGRGLRVRFGESSLSRAIRSVEGPIEDRLLEILRPGDVVYDIGANIGWYSLLAAKRVGPSGQVLAFEPAIANASLVQRNAASNRIENVTVIPAAVSDRDGWAVFLIKNSLMSCLDKDDDEAQTRRREVRNHRIRGRVPVPVLTLDSWIAKAQRDPPNFIKMDVEGAEIGALRGMEQTLRSARPTLIIELHGTRDGVLDLLDSFDYEHEPVRGDGPTRAVPWNAHVLAYPR